MAELTNKIIYPQSKAKLNLQVEGIFAYPEQWKTTDQANPGLFNYIVRIWKTQIAKGKICPRQFTEKELRQQQQAKNKKGGKKEAKKQQNPAEEQRIKKLREKQEEQERKKQQEWNKLNDEQKFNHSSENPYKAALLKFENGNAEIQLTGKDYLIFEERLTQDRGQWVYVYKVPAASEQELAKLKKSKPKNLNLNDLNPIIMRGWLDLSVLNSKTVKQTTVRCKLTQIDRTPQTPEPNLQKTYIKINLFLETPFMEQSDGLLASAFIKDPPQEAEIPPEIACVNELREELKLALESLAMEYSGMFWKELNLYQEQKNTMIFVNMKRNQIQKRKEQFLYDFNVSGKYKILKDRIKRSIVQLCKNKFGEQMKGLASFTGVSCNGKDQIYSQIYHFLVISYRETMENLVKQKMELLREVEVPNEEAQKEFTEKYLQSYNKEEVTEKVQRIVKEHDAIFQSSYGDKIYKLYIAENPKLTELKYKYALYCLKNNLAKAQVVLPFFEEHLERNKDSQQLQFTYLLLLISSEDQNNCKKAWALLRQLIQKTPNNTQYLTLASLLLQVYLANANLSQRYFLLAQRCLLRSEGKLKEVGRHQQQPSDSQVPSLTAIATYNLEATRESKDKLWLDLIDLFSSYNLFNVVSKIKQKITDQQHPSIKLISVKILITQKRFGEALEQAEKIYETNKSYEILNIIIQCLFVNYEINGLTKYLKTAIKACPAEDRELQMFRLGNVYAFGGQYANCKACLTKYLQKNQINSGLSWRLMGLVQLRLNQIDSSIECFRHANLLDPTNASAWLQLASAFTSKGKFVMVNQALNQYDYLLGDQSPDQEILKEIKQKLQTAEYQNFYNRSLKQKLVQRINRQLLG